RGHPHGHACDRLRRARGDRRDAHRAARSAPRAAPGRRVPRRARARGRRARRDGRAVPHRFGEPPRRDERRRRRPRGPQRALTMGLVERVIDFSARKRFLVFLLVFALTAWGLWAAKKTPLDALPDLSDTQVIVATEWMGRSPTLIENQVTYPIVT